MKCYFRVAKTVIILWLNSTIIEFYDVDRLTKIYELKMSSVPNMIRVSNNLSDLLLYYK